MNIIVIDKLCQSQIITTAAMRGSLSLMERGLSRYPAPWDKPAIAAMLDNVCVGVLVLSPEIDEKSVSVCLAWASPEHPAALATMLMRLRPWCAEKGLGEVYFTAHIGNDDMVKAAAALRAELWSQTFRVTL